MEANAETYRSRLNELRIIDTKRTDLIDELLHKLERAETKLQQTQLDLQNEQDARRRLQQDVLENKAQKLSTGRPFVVVLLDADADGYVFQDTFITKATKGGVQAADELLTRIRIYLRGIISDSDKIDVLVKAFANLEGLATALAKNGKLKEGSQLRAFFTGFSSRLAFFDFVDVGSGKERADHKIRESVKFYVDSPQCKHIMLGCCHDSGYAPFLGQFIADNSVSNRVTLLEGSPLPSAIKTLGFKRVTRFPTVFMGRVSQVPKETASSSSSSTGSLNDAIRSIQSKRLGPLKINSIGLRCDRPLQADQALVEKFKNANLCYWLFLRGECAGCSRSHVYRPLTEAEFDALWTLARRNRCAKNGNCFDPKCVYGHDGRRNAK